MSRTIPITVALTAGLAASVLLAGCGKSDKAADPAAASSAAVVFPPSLVTIGDGYPNTGNPCRRVGESPATADVLDHTATLVACPGGADAPAAAAVTALGGAVVGAVDGFTLISVPAADAGGGLDQTVETPAVADPVPVTRPAAPPPPPKAAPAPPGSKRIQFQPGGVGASLAGAVRGYDGASYVVGARGGQEMTVRISGSPNASFNIYAPGDRPGEDEAMFIGEVGGERYRGVLPANGDYTIQVGQPRAQARRGEVSDFRLDVRVE